MSRKFLTGYKEGNKHTLLCFIFMKSVLNEVEWNVSFGTGSAVRRVADVCIKSVCMYFKSSEVRVGSILNKEGEVKRGP